MQAYMQRRKNGPAAERAKTRAAGPSVSELAAGAAPTAEQMGSRVDLPGEIREKMEASFGADFSNVKLFESQTVADAGAEAVTQGDNIAFAPGKLDLTSTAGQALLGHELSHVVSQSRGESAGQGFLNDAHLEAQADRQGMMAAQGESVYSGPVSPVGVSSTASAAGPMQAKKRKNMTAAERLKDDFHHVKMGRTEESRMAGRKQQMQMLLDAHAYSILGNTELAGSDEGAEISDAAQDLLDEVAGSDENQAYAQVLAEMGVGMAQNAMENHANSGGNLDTPEGRYRLFTSADSAELGAASSMLTSLGIQSQDAEGGYREAIGRADTEGYYQRFGDATAGSSKDKKTIGSERANALDDMGRVELNDRAEAWYERLMGRKRKRT